MSLYLPEQKLGSHSADGSSSNKFVLKGRQTGSMHRGHKWVFRAESHDTMIAWYEDIKNVTEWTPEERGNLVRANSRSISRSSQRSSVSSDGVDDEEEPPFTATAASVNQQPRPDSSSRRQSGGRFPSDLQVNVQRGLQVPVSPLSASSGYGESFGHSDPFTMTPLPGGSSDQQSQSLRQGSRPQGVSGDRFQRNTAIDSAAASGAVQFHQPVAVVAQGQSLQESGTGGYSTAAQQRAPSAERKQVTPMWAEPVPIHLPHPHQEVSSAQDGTGNGVYDHRTSATVNGDYDRKRIEPGSSRDGDGVSAGTNGAISGGEFSARPDGAARDDSTQTIAHLHMPGQYPRGSITGS